jgi:ComF family protein
MPAPVNRAASPRVDGWLARLGQAVCRPRCLVCSEPGHGGRDLCLACTRILPWLGAACARCALPLAGVHAAAAAGEAAPASCGACLREPPPLAAVHAAFLYTFPLDRLLPRFKFHHDLAAGHLLAATMVDAFAGLPRPDALVPVPLHLGRLRSRGYDQAHELARPLAAALDVPLQPGLLRRIRATAPQSDLDAGARRGNVRGAFVPVRPTGARMPAHVALVDDVMTTGATLHAAALALHRAGVARVDAWVCARVP